MIARAWVLDTEKLYVAIDKKRRDNRTSFRKLAKDIGVGQSTFSRIGHGRRPDVDTFITLLKWLDISADEFYKEVKHEPQVCRELPFTKVGRHEGGTQQC